jgi:two-component system, sensor histidine kinase and response regulator
LQPPPLIAVVDDEPRNRNLLRAYLEPEFRVVEAADGEKALEVVASMRPDLVLLDVMLPTIDGIEVCRRLKEERQDDYLPILLITALEAQEDRNRGLSCGADDFLTKPVDRTELLLRCRTFLQIRRQQLTIAKQLDDLRRLQALKDDLVALMVHDIRNPLAGLDGYLQILFADLGGHAAQRDLEQALKTSRRVRDILDGILDVRMLEDGALKPRRAPVRIRTVIDGAVDSLAGAAMAMRAKIRTTVPSDPECHMDEKLLRRALENLIANAIKYSPPGEVVDVSGRLAGESVEYEVADRGPGVPHDLRAAVFEKYTTVEGRRGETRRGYGLGLHLVRLVAEAHGGEVQIADRPGGGSIFRLIVPACVPAM